MWVSFHLFHKERSSSIMKECGRPKDPSITLSPEKLEQKQQQKKVDKNILLEMMVVRTLPSTGPSLSPTPSFNFPLENETHGNSQGWLNQRLSGFFIFLLLLIITSHFIVLFKCCLLACGIFPDQGSNLCLLYWPMILNLNLWTTREVPKRYK